ncbi:MAG: electron transfer flavoprotein subunit beta/FixA family protein [Candidatus Bathyarchaeota archaeon]|nr:MAG: electron transfer flavoprotein subunit beta/FixA family protein [Candidatus Bathyarchaeota archaeon]
MPRIIVCLKQALDVSQLKADPSSRKLVTAGVPRKISDFDKNALEEAVSLKEKLGGEVVTITSSAEDAKTSIREALAIGADKGYFVNDEGLRNSCTLATSHVLAEAIKKIGQFDLVLCGEASIDGFSAQIGPRVAEILGIPVLTYARSITVQGDTVTAERSLEDRYETVRTKMPAVITVTREINEPRIPSLMAIMKASKKEIVSWRLADISVPPEKAGEQGSGVKIMDVSAPKVERKKETIQGESPREIAANLVKALIQDGVIGR